MDRVFLVVKGSTHAHIDGKRLSAASTSPETRGDQLEGGDSGAWIGELAFLDHYHRMHLDLDNAAGQLENDDRIGRGLALYTILADDDCEILVWSHNMMDELMELSADLRSALTRAITSAVVAKEVNLTIGNIDRSKWHWASWLTGWAINDGTHINLESSTMNKIQGDPEDSRS